MCTYEQVADKRAWSSTFSLSARSLDQAKALCNVNDDCEGFSVYTDYIETTNSQVFVGFRATSTFYENNNRLGYTVFMKTCLPEGACRTSSSVEVCACSYDNDVSVNYMYRFSPPEGCSYGYCTTSDTIERPPPSPTEPTEPTDQIILVDILPK